MTEVCLVDELERPSRTYVVFRRSADECVCLLVALPAAPSLPSQGGGGGQRALSGRQSSVHFGALRFRLEKVRRIRCVDRLQRKNTKFINNYIKYNWNYNIPVNSFIINEKYSKLHHKHSKILLRYRKITITIMRWKVMQTSFYLQDNPCITHSFYWLSWNYWVDSWHNSTKNKTMHFQNVPVPGPTKYD